MNEQLLKFILVNSKLCFDSGCVFDEDEWIDGTIYDPKVGSTYYCSIEMPNKNKLEVRGSLDPFGLVGRTDTWVRMKLN